VVGLSLAYFGYRYNLPLTVPSGLFPLLKERMTNGRIINDVLFQFERYTGFVRSPEASLLAASPEQQ